VQAAAPLLLGEAELPTDQSGVVAVIALGNPAGHLVQHLGYA
jgi:hypothetical protein